MIQALTDYIRISAKADNLAVKEDIHFQRKRAFSRAYTNNTYFEEIRAKLES